VTNARSLFSILFATASLLAVTVSVAGEEMALAVHPESTMSPALVRILLFVGIAAYIAWILLLGKRETKFWLWSPTSWAVFAGLGLFVYLVSSAGRLSGGGALDPLGPGGIPLLWCILLFPCLIAMGIREWKGWKIPERLSEPSCGLNFSNTVSWFFAALLFFGILLFPLAGYYFIALLLLPGCLFLPGWWKKWTMAILALAWLAVVYFVLHRALHASALEQTLKNA
jgi:hypothetical protein